MTTMEILRRAKAAKSAMVLADTHTKNRALLAMADALEAHAAPILAANALDLEAAKGTVSDVMLDRLALSESRIAGMAQGIREVAALPDPVGEVIRRVERPNGLVIERTAVPMGVIAIIYESRPNVTPTLPPWPSRRAPPASSGGARRPTAPPPPSWTL